MFHESLEKKTALDKNVLLSTLTRYVIKTERAFIFP